MAQPWGLCVCTVVGITKCPPNYLYRLTLLQYFFYVYVMSVYAYILLEISYLYCYLIFLFTSFNRYNLHIIKFAHLKYTIQ